MSDNQILYLLSGLCAAFILFAYRNSKRAGLIHGVIFLLYSGLLYYGLLFDSAYGGAFVWWFYLIIVTALQVVILAGYLLFRAFRKKGM